MTEINSQLMETTFRLHGPLRGQPHQTTFGSVLIVGKEASNKRCYFILVTAAHVLDNIDGDSAFLLVRDLKEDGSYSQSNWEIKIRSNGIPKYVRHAEADAAAMFISMPQFFKSNIYHYEEFANDDLLRKYEIHPGDELHCLGFPLAASTENGFPLLRSGKIASYPIVPTKQHKTILFDFTVFGGNSGGPVYFTDNGRTYGGKTYLNQRIGFLVGIVTSQLHAALFDNERLQIAAVVPGAFILETVRMLPEDPD